MIDVTTIKARRERAGLSKSYMAKVVGIDRHTYAKHEATNFWYADQLAKLDAFFHAFVPDRFRGDKVQYLQNATVDEIHTMMRTLVFELVHRDAEDLKKMYTDGDSDLAVDEAISWYWHGVTDGVHAYRRVLERTYEMRLAKEREAQLPEITEGEVIQ